MNKAGVELRTEFLKLVFFACLCCWSETAWPRKQTLTLKEEEVLTVKVKQEGPVRISVKGDRLQDVMGLDDSVTIEKDESHGFLYLRNLGQKQFLTIITESGALQDLILIPDTQGASVVVLKSQDEERAAFRQPAQPLLPTNSAPSPASGFFSNSFFQDQVLLMIKQLYQGAGSVEGIDQLAERSTAYNLTAKPVRSLLGPGLRGEVYELINTTETTLNLVEKDFYLLGDCALSLGKKQLESSEQTLLIVVCHG